MERSGIAVRWSALLCPLPLWTLINSNYLLGKLYLSGEDGDIFVVNSGPEFELLTTNTMGELLMATPAISEGMIYVRAEHHLFAVGR